jgi:hypothetical protein
VSNCSVLVRLPYSTLWIFNVEFKGFGIKLDKFCVKLGGVKTENKSKLSVLPAFFDRFF